MLKKISIETKLAFVAALVMLVLLTVNVLSAVCEERADSEVKKFIVSEEVIVEEV